MWCKTAIVQPTHVHNVCIFDYLLLFIAYYHVVVIALLLCCFVGVCMYRMTTKGRKQASRQKSAGFFGRSKKLSPACEILMYKAAIRPIRV